MKATIVGFLFFLGLLVFLVSLPFVALEMGIGPFFNAVADIIGSPWLWISVVILYVLAKIAWQDPFRNRLQAPARLLKSSVSLPIAIRWPE